MPEENVSDFKDVFEAINRLCDTMKTSRHVDYDNDMNTTETEYCNEHDTDKVGAGYDSNVVEIHPSMELSDIEPTLGTSQIDAVMTVSEYESNQFVSECDSSTLVASENDSTMIASTIESSMLASEIFSSMMASQNNDIAQESTETEAQPETVDYVIESTAEAIQKQDVPERWSDAMSHISLQDTMTSDTNTGQCEAGSEAYYTASSEVSLLSDTELPEKTQDDKCSYVIAGHVAAMREKFESMTRSNTPCQDMTRSLSRSLELLRNASPSPDNMA